MDTIIDIEPGEQIITQAKSHQKIDYKLYIIGALCGVLVILLLYIYFKSGSDDPKPVVEQTNKPPDQGPSTVPMTKEEINNLHKQFAAPPSENPVPPSEPEPQPEDPPAPYEPATEETPEEKIIN